MSTDAEMQQQFRQLKREISRLKSKASAAHDREVAAVTRAHDAKLRAKTAEHGLRRLLQRCRIAEQRKINTISAPSKLPLTAEQK